MSRRWIVAVGRAHWCGGGCGPCALVRWRRVLDTTIARQSTRAVAELLRTRRKSPTPATTPAKALGRSTTKPWLRRCSRPLTNGDTAPTHPAPEPARNSTSHLAPQADTGLTHDVPAERRAVDDGPTKTSPLPLGSTNRRIFATSARRQKTVRSDVQQLPF